MNAHATRVPNSAVAIFKSGHYPAVMVGKPVIRGTRLTIDYVLNRLGHGSTIDELLEEYDRLTAADIQSCLLFASKAISEVDFVPRVVSCGAGRSGPAAENPTPAD